MKNDRLKSALLTLVQYVSLLLLLLYLPFTAPNPILLSIQVGGIILGLWAIVAMSRSKLNITPLPRNGSILITSGPYHLIRHPMYLALILFFYPVAIPSGSPVILVILLIFTANMILKLLFEEKVLTRKFYRYMEYRQNTWRLLPWIF